MRLHFGDNRRARCFRSRCVELFQQRVARGSFDQAENGSFVFGSDDCIGLPISDARSLFNNRWTLINVDSVGD